MVVRDALPIRRARRYTREMGKAAISRSEAVNSIEARERLDSVTRTTKLSEKLPHMSGEEAECRLKGDLYQTAVYYTRDKRTCRCT
jgi:hypothetical protein